VRYADCHPDRKHFCKGKCHACHGREYRAAHPEVREYARKYNRQYRIDNLEKLKAYDRVKAQKLQNNPEGREKLRRYALHHSLARRGITPDEFKQRLAKGCEICGAAIGLVRQDYAVDHDHATNQTRGILCPPCNKGLGGFRDRIDLLRKAEEYLVVHGSNNKDKAKP